MAERRDEKELTRLLLRDAKRRERISVLGGPVLGVLFSGVLVGTAALPLDGPARRATTLHETVVKVVFPGFRLIPVRASVE